MKYVQNLYVVGPRVVRLRVHAVNHESVHILRIMVPSARRSSFSCCTAGGICGPGFTPRYLA